MTAAPAASQAWGDRQLLPTLQTIHGQWLQNAHKMLESARRSEAGILCRSAAVRSLNTDLSPRLHLERALVESVGQMVEPRHAAQLWVAAELLATLDWQLDHELGRCHRANEFSILTRKFEKALGHWCRAVEEALGPLSWDDIPEQARQRLALLGAKEVHHDS